MIGTPALPIKGLPGPPIVTPQSAFNPFGRDNRGRRPAAAALTVRHANCRHFFSGGFRGPD
jgi:hypothetical protein